MNHILWQPSLRGLPHIELDKTIIFFQKVNVSIFRICNFRSQNVMSLLKIDPEIIIQTIVNDPKYLKISEMDQNWIKHKLFKSVDVVSSKDLSDSEMNFQIFIYSFSIIQVKSYLDFTLISHKINFRLLGQMNHQTGSPNI